MEILFPKKQRWTTSKEVSREDMRTKRVIAVGVISILIMSICLAGCSNYQKRIEGSWTVAEAIHIEMDGTTSDVSEYRGLPILEGTDFTFSKSCHIENSQKDVLCEYKVKKDVIEFRMDDSESIEFEYS